MSDSMVPEEERPAESMRPNGDAEYPLVGPPTDAPLSAVVSRVYESLRALANRMMQRQRTDHTLQATALVHEAYVRLASSGNSTEESPAKFISLVASTMRSVLVDHARSRGAAKRGGGRVRVPFDDLADTPSSSLDLVALDEALSRLALLDERKSKLVELRYFAGLSAEETGEVLGISLATVKRDWVMARAWLLREITTGDQDGD